MTALAAHFDIALPTIERAEANGVSEAAINLNRLLSEALIEARMPLSRDRMSSLREQLFQIRLECNTAGWDGHSARAVEMDAVHEAEMFLECLPGYIASPDIVPDASGAVQLEWRQEQNQILTISLTGAGTLNYAGILGGGAETYGVEKFLGIPPAIIKDLLVSNFRNRRS